MKYRITKALGTIFGVSSILSFMMSLSIDVDNSTDAAIPAFIGLLLLGGLFAIASYMMNKAVIIEGSLMSIAIYIGSKLYLFSNGPKQSFKKCREITRKYSGFMPMASSCIRSYSEYALGSERGN